MLFSKVFETPVTYKEMLHIMFSIYMYSFVVVKLLSCLKIFVKYEISSIMLIRVKEDYLRSVGINILFLLSCPTPLQGAAQKIMEK